MILCLLALPFLSAIKDSQGRPFDDLPAAVSEVSEHRELRSSGRTEDLMHSLSHSLSLIMLQIASDSQLRNAVLVGIASIGLFNFFGLSVTKALSGSSRAAIDACRTMFVWMVAMYLGWEVFHRLQIVGFLVLVSGVKSKPLLSSASVPSTTLCCSNSLFPGSSLYNEILKTFLPQVYPLEEDRYSDDDGASSDLEAPLLMPSMPSGGSPVGGRSPKLDRGSSRGGSGFLAPIASGASGSTSSMNNLEGQTAQLTAGHAALPKPVKIKGSSASHHQQQQVGHG